MLKLSHVKKTFNKGTVTEKRALTGVDLTLNDGDFVTVIGGNGAGKSTLLNMIAGVYPLDSGVIELDGTDISRLSESQRAKYLGRVFQDPMRGTAADMQIAENLALAKRRGQRRGLSWGVTKAEKDEYVELLKRLDLGLDTRLNAKVGLLSGGQRQALTLLMATLTRPRLLLLDEHTAALDPKMLLELAQNGFVVNQCYGMTETFGDGILNFTQVEKHMSAVGKPDDHVQYKLDETGEICIKGDCVMLGYYKDPEATAEVIDADGWFHTGDLARMDEEGFYYITGRKKNLIILASGENVSPEELEKKLALCPAITECIVKEKGQKICAVIYCPEDKQEEVRAFVIEVNRSLPLYKRISAVEFTVEPLPRNALGKLLRK